MAQLIQHLTINEILPLFKIQYREQAVQGALAAGQEKEGELATTSLQFQFHLQYPCGSLSIELSDFRQSAQSGNDCKCRCKQTLKNIIILMSSLPISISHQLFRCRFSNSRDIVASSPSFSCPATRAPRRACSQANLLLAKHENSSLLKNFVSTS